MPIKMSDLADLINKVVTVQIDISNTSEDEDFREITGKLLAATSKGIVVQTRSNTEIIELSALLDVEEAAKRPTLHIVRRWIKTVTLGTPTGVVVKRWIEEAAMPSVRQHLTDRHGVPLDLIKALSPEAAMTMHQGIDHSLLGHEHGTKPPGKRGRKPKNKEEEGQK